MKHKITMAQSGSGVDYIENLLWADEALKKAKEEESELVVFPEAFMVTIVPGVTLEKELADAQELDGPFVTRMRELAAHYAMWTIFGIHEPADTSHNYNTIVILNDKGDIVSTYKKTHLYDAFKGRESDRIKAGDNLFEPIDTPVGKVGVFVCYELRFPEVSRYEIMNGADILIVPAAWVKGKNKSEALRNLVMTRAIENTVYAVMCDKCEGICIGESVAIDPLGNILAEAGAEPCVITVEIDSDIIEKARGIVPVLKNRRPELY